MRHSTNPMISVFQNVLTSLSIFSSPAKSNFSNTDKHANATSRHKRLVEKTCEYLIKNIDQELNQVNIAKAMNTNRDRLARAFKEEMGMGVASWLRQQRMNVARDLLTRTDRSVFEISVSVGYHDQANFSTTFKNIFEQSPQQYRKDNKAT